MSDISAICDLINTQFTNATGQLKGKPFQKGLFNGLCKQVDRVVGETLEKQIILYTDVNGTKATGIYVDDLYPFQLYHRILDQNIEDSEIEDFYGDDILQKIVTFEMALVCIVDKFNVELNSEDVITAVGLNMPNNIKPSAITGSQFSQCEITTTNVETNSSTVFSDEYGRNKQIPQQFYLFKIEYTVKLHYTKSCFTLC